MAAAFHPVYLLPGAALTLAYLTVILRTGGGVSHALRVGGFTLLLVLPQAFTAVYLVSGLLGLAGWSSIEGQRIGVTVALYVMAFSIVGQPFNQYWGSMYAPLLCFGVARLPASVADLWHAADWRAGRPLAVGQASS